MSDRKPLLLIFAGPNGSGKSTITQHVDVVGTYINADDIQKERSLHNIEAAKLVTSWREELVQKREDFTYETVFSTYRHIELINKAKKHGYFIKCIYVLTADVEINVQRVKSRTLSGGHDVPEDAIRRRYPRCVDILPELIKLCDVIHIYDNSGRSFSRIYKKRKGEEYIWTNEFWSQESIEQLVHSC